MAERTEYTYDLFISYAEADRAWVEGYLLDALDRAGVDYHSEAAFTLGVPRLLEFERAVQESARTLLVLSPAYLAEGFTQFTDLLAQSYGLETAIWPVIPLILHPVELSPRLAMLTALNATDQDDWQAVVERLCVELEHPVPSPAPKLPCPYPGMVPFSEADSDRFFGRDEDVQELMERLRLHPFLTVIGPSGSGKSSLVFAGLVPALRESGLFGDGEWLVRSVRPGEAPTEALEAAVGDVINLKTFQRVNRSSDRLLLVVDQFEEVFTLASDEALPFQKALLRLSQAPNTTFVLTVRADFYPDLMTSPLWSEVQAHRLEALPLDDAGLRQAIVRPAEDVGVFVETALVERLVADAGDEPGILPFVQETMVLLWEKVERRFLPLRAYEALVLPRRAYGAPPLTGLQVAMARRADAALAGLTTEQQVIARRIFLRLIQFGEGRADTRRQRPTAALRSAGDDFVVFEETLHHLADHRLLTLSGEEEGAAKQVDIAHEALISGWSTLQDWQTERREAEHTRRRLEAKAAEWERLGRGSGGLLDEVELLEAERWLEGPDAADLGYSEALLALVDASKVVIEKEERQKRKQRVRRILIPFLAAGLAIMLVLAAWATRQWQRAESYRLANLALQQLNVDPVASIHLSRHALPGTWFSKLRPYVPQAEFALAQAVQTNLEQACLNIPGKTINEVAFGKQQIAVANDDLLLVGYGLSDASVNKLGEHGKEIVDVQWSKSGRLLSYDLDTVRIWDANSMIAERIFRSNGVVKCAEWHPDSEHIAVCSGTTLWQWFPGAEEHLRKVYTASAGTIWGARWSPDGKRLVVWSSEETHLVSVDNSTPPILLEGHTDDVFGAQFVSSEQIITWSYDGTARLWGVDGEEICVFDPSEENATVRGVAFSDDGKRLLTFLDNGAAFIWDVETGEQVVQLAGHDLGILDAAWRDDYLATASADQTVRIWDTSTGAEVVILRGHTNRVEGVRWLGRERLLTWSGDGFLRIWQIFDESGLPLCYGSCNGLPMCRNLSRGFIGHDGAILSARWLDDETILTTGRDGTARRWSLETGEVHALTNESGKTPSILWNPEGDRVLTYVGNGNGKIWNFETQDLICETEGPISSTFWTRAGLLISQSSGYARLIDPSTYDTFITLEGHHREIVDAQLHDNHLATAGADMNIIVWDMRTGDMLSQLSLNQQPVGLQWDKDGVRLLVAERNGSVSLWNAHTGEQLLSLTRDTEYPAQSAVLSPNGRYIAAAIGEEFVIWDAKNGDLIRHNKGHNDRVLGMKWNRDGSRLLTWGADGSARLWNENAGFEEVMRLSDTECIRMAAFNENNSRILTGGASGRLIVWQAWPDIQSLVEVAERHCTRDLTEQQENHFDVGP